MANEQQLTAKQARRGELHPRRIATRSSPCHPAGPRGIAQATAVHAPNWLKAVPCAIAHLIDPKSWGFAGT